MKSIYVLVADVWLDKGELENMVDDEEWTLLQRKGKKRFIFTYVITAGITKTFFLNKLLDYPQRLLGTFQLYQY